MYMLQLNSIFLLNSISIFGFKLITNYTYEQSANEQIMRILLRNKIHFFSHLTVSWSLSVARIIFLKRCYLCNT